MYTIMENWIVKVKTHKWDFYIEIDILLHIRV